MILLVDFIHKKKGKLNINLGINFPKLGKWNILGYKIKSWLHLSIEGHP